MTEPRPMGMRIQRPYQTEEEFIRGDGLTIGRTGMILPNAPARPPGIIIRFEIVLADGAVAFRGEGKVIAHRVHSNGRKGLEVRFTRLDSHSREVIEKVLELRKSGELTPSPPVAQIPDLTPSPEGSRVAPRTEIVIKPPEPEPVPESEPIAMPAVVAADIAAAGHGVSPEVDRVEEPAPVAIAAAVVSHDPEHDHEPVSVREPEPEPEPVGMPAVVATDIAAASASVFDEEEPIEEPRDEDPTPFAPPAFLAEMERGSSPEPLSSPGPISGPGPISSTEPRSGLDRGSSPELVHAELDKLRDRRAVVSAPTGRDDLLARLRRRRSSG